MDTITLPANFGIFFPVILPCAGREPRLLVDSVFEMRRANGDLDGHAIVRDVQVMRGTNVPRLARVVAGVPGGEFDHNAWYDVLTMQWVEPRAVTEQHLMELEPAIPGASAQQHRFSPTMN